MNSAQIRQATNSIPHSALAGGNIADGGINLLALAPQMPAKPVLAETAIPTALRFIQIESGHAAEYDRLLAGGAQ